MALVVAHTEVGFSLRAVGELAAASEHLERALALFNEEDFRSFPLSFAVNALGNILLVDALCGREGARVRHEEALFAAAEHHGAAADLALARVYALSAAAIRRDAEYLGSLAPRLVEYCVEQKLDMFLLSARIYSGLALVAHGRLPEGIALLRESLDQQKAAGFLTLRAFVLSWLIGGHLSNSALPEAAATLDEAFAAIRDEEVWRVELLRLKGDLLRAQCGMRNAESREASPQSKIRNPQLIEAERCYREAIERARAMGAHVFTLRAASHLARFLHTLQRTAEARAVLEPVYASFTEGFSTRDLIEAKALLEELEREI
jgi:tetratricopeptide (TPR) repeat protein